MLPEAAEAPQLALEVILGASGEALQPTGAPIDGVHLDERVDELLADPPALPRRIQRRADQAVLGQEGQQRIEHEQRLAGVARGGGVRRDDVV
ncbi:MAG: hypothetical protein M3376_09010 [Actinomycetota bacterium]|nr:hypothetical protein [Actinomycetota bacterium]